MSNNAANREVQITGAPSSPPTDERLLVKWIESQGSEEQLRLVPKYLKEFLCKAAQPRHASGNACTKLCYFVEQCRNSTSSEIRDLVFSQRASFDLFSFYINWNDKNQHRSMRQVLDLVSTLMAKNPDQAVSEKIRVAIVQRSLSILAHQAALTLVKPALKSLEYLLGKRAISSEDIITVYEVQSSRKRLCADSVTISQEDLSWDGFFSEIFGWMALPDVSPAAGKFLVTIFKDLRTKSGASEANHTLSWQHWIQRGLSKDPQALESVKNYVFQPLFKLDRIGSLKFLEELNAQDVAWDNHNEKTSGHALLQLAALETGKKTGLVEEPNETLFQKISTKQADAVVVLREEAMGPLLCHSSKTVRSLAFSVLVTSSSTIRPYTKNALDLLQQSIPVLYSDTDAKFRNEVLSNTKHMIERLRGATALLARNIENFAFQLRSDSSLSESQRSSQEQRRSEMEGLLQKHESFLNNYMDFLLQELLPTSTYQRHIMALKAILLLLRSGILQQGDSPALKAASNSTVWPYSVNFFTLDAVELLIGLLMNPFDDVRSTATDILKFASTYHFELKAKRPGLMAAESTGAQEVVKILSMAGGKCSAPAETEQPLNLLLQFIETAEDLSKQTGRADYADGVARSYELLYNLETPATAKIAVLVKVLNDLEQKVTAAEMNLGKAVIEAPVHGTFAALNLVWGSIDAARDFQGDDRQTFHRKAWEDFQRRIVDACSRIWRAVRDILCNDSPEGYLPAELDDFAVIDTKDVLSYSFRAVHESSNLLRTVINGIKKSSSDKLPLLAVPLLARIGDLSFEQLSTLRHRGAFSTVSLTFAQCCLLSAWVSHRGDSPSSAPPATSSALLDSWYLGTLNCVYTQSSTTRRSAGMPALLAGIMAAISNGEELDAKLAQWKAMARLKVPRSNIDATHLSQVHALNGLKEMFRSSVLAKRIDGHLADCLQIAADSIQSTNYAIKNGGLMLFRALSDVLLGTSEGKASVEDGWDGQAVKLSYERYPSLTKILLDMLYTKYEEGKAAVHAVLPALQMLHRAGPPATEEDRMYQLVKEYLGSAEWHVREMAALVVCSFNMGPEHDIAQTISDLLQLERQGNMGENALHGSLMAIKFLLLRKATVTPQGTMAAQLVQVLYILQGIRGPTYIVNGESAFIQTAWLRIFNTVGLIYFSSQASMTASGQVREALEQAPREELGQLLLVVFNVSVPAEREKCRCLAKSVLPEQARRLMITTFLRGHDGEASDKTLCDNIIFLGNIDSESALAALDFLPIGMSISADAQLVQICTIYVGIITFFVDTDFDITTVAVTKLAESLEDHFFDTAAPRDRDLLLQRLASIKDLDFCGQSSPKLANAWVRLSGWLVLVQRYWKPGDSNVQALYTTWANWLRGCGTDNSPYDTRLAAARSLKPFTNIAKELGAYDVDMDNEVDSTMQSLIPIIFVLYDTLNDDDDDIRGVGAQIVGSMLRTTVEPVTAQKYLCRYLLTIYGRTPAFVQNVIFRVTGSKSVFYAGQDIPLKLEVTRFSTNSSTIGARELFSVEDQNLWLDPISDHRRWCRVLLSISPQAYGPEPSAQHENLQIVALLSWAEDTLSNLNKAHLCFSLSSASSPDSRKAYLAIAGINAVLDHFCKLFNRDDIALSIQPSLSSSHMKASSLNNRFTQFLLDRPKAKEVTDQAFYKLLLSRASLDADTVKAIGCYLGSMQIEVTNFPGVRSYFSRLA